MKNIYAEISPILPDGNITTIRLCSSGTSSMTTNQEGYTWLPIITGYPSYSFNLISGRLLTESTISYGDISFSMSYVFDNEEWSTYDWSGALARLWWGDADSEFSTYQQIFEGSVSALSREGFTGSLALLGPEANLNVNLLYNSYEGIGGPEGEASIKGTLKPWCSGDCKNVAPVLIDTVYWVYQVHGYGPINDIPTVYEFAQRLDAPVAIVSSYEDLIALELSPGQWAKAPDVGMFRLGGQPSQLLTCDVKGAMDGEDYPTSVSKIIKHMIKTASPSSQFGDLSLFDNVDWCMYETSQAVLGDVVRKAAYQAGGYLFADGSGVWKMGDFFNPKQSGTLSEDGDQMPIVVDIKETTSAGPYYSFKIGYDRCWTKHSDSDISPALLTIAENADAIAADVESAKQAAEQAQADLVVARSRLDAMSSDGTLDRSEKKYWKTQYTTLAAEKLALLSDSEAFANVDSEIAALNNAWVSLDAYLATLTPAWDDFTQDTTINRNSFKAYWDAIYVARWKLNAAMSVDASNTALWELVADPAGTKPEDNATKGAPAGTYVGDTLAEDVNTILANSQASIINIQGDLDALGSDVSYAKDTADQAKADILVAQQDIVSNAGNIQSVSDDLSTAYSKISENKTAIDSQAGSISTITQELKSGGNPNLLPNGDLSNGSTNFLINTVSWAESPLIGPRLLGTLSAVMTNELVASGFVTVTAGSWYCFSADIHLSNLTTGSVVMDMKWYDANNNLVLDGANHTVSQKTWGGNRDYISEQAPTGATKVICRIYVNQANVGTTFGVRKMKLENSQTPTVFSNEATITNINKTLTTNTSQIATAQSSLAVQDTKITNIQTAISTQDANIATIEQKINVNNGGNLVNNWADGSFEDWSTNDPVEMFDGTNDANFSQQGLAGWAVRVRNHSGWMRSNSWAVRGGERYYIELPIYRSTGDGPISGPTYLQMRYNIISDGVETATYSSTAYSNANGWATLSQTVIVPDNAISASLWIRPIATGGAGRVYLLRPVARPMLAQVAQTMEALTTVENKTIAYLEQTVAAGSSSAAVKLNANGNSSSVELQADAIRLGSAALPAMDVKDGKVLFHGDVTIGGMSSITDPINLVRNDWSNNNYDGWTLGPWTTADSDSDVQGRDIGLYGIKSKTRDAAYSPVFNVQPGRTYKCQVWFYNANPGVQTAIWMHLMKDNFAPVSYALVTAKTITNAWTFLDGEITIPANQSIGKAWFLCQQETNGTIATNNYVRFRKPKCFMKTDNDLIVNGSVTANKMTVSSLSSITGTIGTLQTSTSGARSVLTDNGLFIYGANGKIKIKIGKLN